MNEGRSLRPQGQAWRPFWESTPAGLGTARPTQGCAPDSRLPAPAGQSERGSRGPRYHHRASDPKEEKLSSALALHDPALVPCTALGPGAQPRSARGPSQTTDSLRCQESREGSHGLSRELAAAGPPRAGQGEISVSE